MWKPRQQELGPVKSVALQVAHEMTPSASKPHPLNAAGAAAAGSPLAAASSLSSEDVSGAHVPAGAIAAYDPLSAKYDPLSASAVSSSSASANAAAAAVSARHAADDVLRKDHERQEFLEDDFVPWSARKAGILQRYTTNESIAIQVNFLETPVVAPGTQQDRTQQRLEQLDQSLESQEKQISQLTQLEYLRHIEDLHTELIHAWNHDERVKALKIAIQCAKVLADTSVVRVCVQLMRLMCGFYAVLISFILLAPRPLALGSDLISLHYFLYIFFSFDFRQLLF